MAYCRQCGAYIPDGQTKCLACGFDETAQQSGAAYAYQSASGTARDERAEAEARRAKRQEYNKTWAENEQRQRKMEEEFKRRQQQAEQRAESYVNRDAGARQSSGRTETANRGLAALSYLGALFVVPMLAGQDDPFVKFHARQGAKLFLCWAAGSALASIVSAGWVVWLLGIYLAYVGIRNVIRGKMEALPIIGNWLWN